MDEKNKEKRLKSKTKKHREQTETSGNDVDHLVERNSAWLLTKQTFNMCRETQVMTLKRGKNVHNFPATVRVS